MGIVPLDLQGWSVAVAKRCTLYINKLCINVGDKAHVLLRQHIMWGRPGETLAFCLDLHSK